MERLVTVVSTGVIIFLGAFAGLTIYLGLPLAFFKKAPQTFKSFCNMFATGILVFLFFDVVGKATETINAALNTLSQQHTGLQTVFAYTGCMVFGFLVGLLGLVYFNKYIIARYKPSRPGVSQSAPLSPALSSETATKTAIATLIAPSPVLVATAPTLPSPVSLALVIAIGIGLHNFSEGLAIGQAAAHGALSLATILIVGFGLHNMTEGFGIAGPLTTEKVSWKFILLLGLIGGGPTFLGTMLGTVYQSDLLFILFLALAAGSILYVIVELLGVARRFASLEIIAWGLAAGFLLGYLTDLIVTYAGS